MSTHYLLDYAGGRLEVGTLGRYRKRMLAVIAGNMVEDLVGKKKGLSLDPLNGGEAVTCGVFHTNSTSMHYPMLIQ